MASFHCIVVAAARVAERCDHVLSSCQLSTVLVATWPQSTSCAVRVTGFAEGTSVDPILWLFENPRRSGGGPVMELYHNEEDASAVITFYKREGLSVFRAFLKVVHCLHMFSLNIFSQMFVFAHICFFFSFVLYGFQPEINVLIFYSYQLNLVTAKLTYVMTLCADAERVAKRQDLTLSDAKLSITWLEPGRPPTFVTALDDTYFSDRFLFVDLPRGLDFNKLEQYAEKAAGIDVDKIVFSCTNPSAALIVYATDPGINFFSILFLLFSFFIDDHSRPTVYEI